MKIELSALALVGSLATSAAFAEEPHARQPVELQPAAREQTLVEELAAGMREIIRAVTPEISLPSIEVKLPSLDALAKR